MKQLSEKAKTQITELCDKSKTHSLLRKIDRSNLPYEEKNFLMDAARRHNVFNDEKIADYYSEASKEMKRLMKVCGLVETNKNN